MNKKLLYKTQRIYLTYFVVVFIITAPLFYLIIHQMYIANADESLRLRAYQFRKDNVFSLQEADIPIWNKYNRDVKILQNKELKTDRIFYAYYYEDQEEETELYRELNAPISIDNKRYTLSARTNLLESEDLIIGIVILFIVILILLLIGLFVINRSLSNRLWKPFYQTLQKIEDFEIDKSRKPIFPDSNIEEFNRLSSSVENLIIRNISIYDDQLEFVENAAHELQTPIAIFKAQIDTLIQRADVTDGQSEILGSLNDTISRLNRLNKNLLSLSRVDKDQFNKTEVFSIKKLLKKQLCFFEEQALQNNIDIKTAFHNDFKITANMVLVEILVNNLLLNAIRHNIPNGRISITLTNKTLQISNTGMEKALPQKQLFKRFSKTNPSGKGTGLGLAIAKKIVHIYGWTISYSFKGNKHIFSIRF